MEPRLEPKETSEEKEHRLARRREHNREGQAKARAATSDKATGYNVEYRCYLPVFVLKSFSCLATKFYRLSG